MSFLTGPKRTKTRYLIEVAHDADECGWVMDEIIGRGPQYGSMSWWGCRVGEHRAWAMLDGPGWEAVLEEALPPALRARALAHRVSCIDGPELRDRPDARDAARR
jgi:hypothetical protein